MLRQRGEGMTLIVYPFIRSPEQLRPGTPALTADPATREIRLKDMVVNGDQRVDQFLQAVAVCRDHIEEYGLPDERS